MRVTWDNRVDLDLSAVATCDDITDYLERQGEPVTDIWCGSVRLDSDHRAGLPPLVHGASLGRAPSRPDVCLTDPHLAVICGPDAGHMVPLTSTGTSIGRLDSCGLPLDDDAVSHRHANAGFDGAAWVRDAGSRNGTQLIRPDGTHSRRRRLRPQPGDRLALGSSVLEVRPLPAAQPDTPSFTPPSSTQLSAMGAGAMTGIVLAAVTGRWYFALLALAYPLTMAVPMLVRRLRTRTGWEATTSPPGDPCLHATPRDDVQLLSNPIAVVGPTARALATARGLLLAAGIRPHDDHWVEPWMRWLPRADEEQAAFVVAEGTPAPSWAATVVEANDAGCTVLSGTTSRVTGLCQVSAHTADALARRLAAAHSAQTLPRAVAWADLDRTHPATAAGRALATGIGVNEDGSVTLDLDTHGPHLLVAGTTGSGKSALLETLVLGLAYEHSPEDLVIALIDFKGGAGLRHCMDLPHVVGCLTDLDRHLAERALVALGVELEQRKRAVSAAGHGSLAEWEAAGGAPPRLLVVADEYQEIAQHHRDFMPNLARLAAQGRSLGLHLVLATQRPAGAVTPEIRANVTTTVALRVASAAESQDLLGTSDAAHLPIDTPGRAIVAHGSQHVTVQVARPSIDATAPVRPAGEEVRAQPAELAAAAAGRWQDQPRGPRLWCDPLPRDIDLPDQQTSGSGVAGESTPALVLGLADWPNERRQGFVTWDPAKGSIVVVGPRGSGRTSTLRLLADQASAAGLVPVWLPPNPREAARTIALAEARDDVLLLVDDAGVALGALAERDHGAPADMLTRRLSRGAPTALAMASHDPTRLASAASMRVVLTGADASDDAMWNVPRVLAGRAPVPGRGRLGAHGQWCEVQLCTAPSVKAQGRSTPPPALVEPLPTACEVRVACDSDPRLLGIGGDDASRIYPEPGEITVVGPPSQERADICAHLERVMSADGAARTVAVRDEVLSFTGAPRISGTIVIVRATERSVRDACGATPIGVVDGLAGPGRVVVVSESDVYALQFPQPSEPPEPAAAGA